MSERREEEDSRRAEEAQRQKELFEAQERAAMAQAYAAEARQGANMSAAYSAGYPGPTSGRQTWLGLRAARGEGSGPVGLAV